MSVATLLKELATTGIRLSAAGEGLHVEAKPGTVTPELRQRLTAHKAEIMAELRTNDSALMARCREACRGLPILPAALFASLTSEDKAAQASGEEGPKVLRAYATAIAGTLARVDAAAEDYRAERAADCTESGKSVACMRLICRYRLNYGTEWHYYIARECEGVADVKRRLRARHGREFTHGRASPPYLRPSVTLFREPVLPSAFA